MAWLQVSFISTTLRRTVPLNVLIPAESPLGFPPKEEKPFKTLYLLHGYMGNYTDWLTNTKITEMSQMMNLAVVMPSGDNSFYVDMEQSGQLYSEFIGHELVEFTRKLLPLSNKREDTIIAGLSMGGYGAIHNGLKHNDVFGHIIALSSALVLNTALIATDEINMMGINKSYFESVFGDLTCLMDSINNPEVLAKKVLDTGVNIPDLYFACGFNDMLVYDNRKFRDYLDSINFPYVYEEGPGTHEWAFWNTFLKKGLDRLFPMPKLDMKPPFWVDAEIKP